VQRKEANTNSNNWTLRYTFVLLFIFSTACVAYAQVEMPPDAAPPPLKIISKAEKEQLASAKEVKDRTKLSLALMDARVKIAEQYLPQEQYEMIFRELGGFHALVIDALEYLANSDTNRDKVLDNFKRFEIGLRTFTLRLELIHREMPPQREYYLRLLMREIRDARAKAMEPLFGDVGIKRTSP